MPALRTEITEIVTGLAIFGYPDLEHALSVEPPAFKNVPRSTYRELRAEFASGSHDALFRRAWENGFRFARSDEGLRGRTPWMVEWKGPHRPPGYDRIPADLRVDHVFLVSCKFGSNILMNSSPSNLFDRLLADRQDEPTDWFGEIAPESYQSLFEVCRDLVDAPLPDHVSDLTQEHRDVLKGGLPRRLQGEAQRVYLEFVSDVAERSAARWREGLASRSVAEAAVWRLLRLESAPYFVLGESAEGHPIAHRVVTPGDLRRTHRFRGLEVSPAAGRGQPIVDWEAQFIDQSFGREVSARGHVEVRWSHGKFAQVPEAKVYLDSPHRLVPGYVPLDEPDDPSSPRLF
jgi:hypothetical protein